MYVEGVSEPAARSATGTMRRALTDRLLRMGGELGLFGEEIEPKSGQQLGNYPQAFTHLALINAVNHVIADEIRANDWEGQTAVFSQMRGKGRG